MHSFSLRDMCFIPYMKCTLNGSIADNIDLIFYSLLHFHSHESNQIKSILSECITKSDFYNLFSFSLSPLDIIHLDNGPACTDYRR